MKKLIYALLMLLCVTTASAQRNTDPLDRGLVAVKKVTGVFCSWRILPEEYYDVKYNIYRNGTKLNSEPLNVSNYTDNSGTASNTYTVRAVVNGVEQADSKVATVWATGRVAPNNNGQGAEQPNYLSIQMQDVVDRNGNIVFCSCGNHTPDASVAQNYTLNDCSVADIDGDGEVEIMVKRINASDANASDPYAHNGEIYSTTNTRAFVIIEAYKLNGRRLWWIDCGPNMVSLNSTEINVVAYDWDEDGKAEVLMRGADNMIIHMADGTSYNVGDMSKNYRSSMSSHSDSQYAWTKDGDEFLLYLNGATAQPYSITEYPLKRLEAGETLASAWSEGNAGRAYGHRSSKYFFGAPVLDGRKASIFLARGIYTQTKMIALDVDPATHALTTRWTWKCNTPGSAWYGQGNHNINIADVDGDGCDEIVYGSMVIDNNGKGLSTTGLGHGDALHTGDLDPFRKGMETFACNEDNPSNNYRNAATCELYFREPVHKDSKGKDIDDGRCMAGNFSNEYPGSIGASTMSGVISLTTNTVISGLANNCFQKPWTPMSLNGIIYWDGDLCAETFDATGTEGEGVVSKLGNRIMQSSGCMLNNDSKNNPCFQGDILGDWREELILRASDNKSLRVFTTTDATSYRIPSLWFDPEYRQAMVWQMCAYNQPPHPSFFLGEMEGITAAPPALSNAGKTEIAVDATAEATINSSVNDKDLLVVVEPGKSYNKRYAITLDGNIAPNSLTINAPVIVSGNNDNNNITSTAYSCNISYTNNGTFSGNMRLIKQGEGALTLPNKTMTYTGQTDIWEGSVTNQKGSISNSKVWLNRHTTLNTTSGSFNGGIEMNYNATFNVTTSAYVSNLTMNYGSRVVLDHVASTTDAAQNTQVYINGTLTVDKKDWQYGPQYLAPVFQIGSASALAIGEYPIGNIANVSGRLSDVIIEGNFASGTRQMLKKKDGILYLSVFDENEEPEKEKMMVSYNLNGHGAAIADVTDATTIPSPLPTPAADGYYFWGWFTDQACTVAAVAGAEITQNTTLYAKWTDLSTASGAWSIDFAAIGDAEHLADKAGVTISNKITRINGVDMGVVNMGNTYLNSSFVIQTGTSWMYRTEQKAIYSSNGGNRTIGLRGLKAGQTITMNVALGDNATTIGVTNATLTSSENNIWVYNVTANGDVSFSLSRYTYIYSIDVSEVPAFVAQPTGTNLSLRFTSTDAVTNATENITKDNFTIAASSSGTISIDSNSKTIDGVSFTHRLKLGGTGNASHRYVSFPVTGPCSIKVYGVTSSSNEERSLTIASGPTALRTTLKTDFCKTSSTPVSEVYDYTGTEPTTIYIYSTNSGYNIYGIDVMYYLPLSEDNNHTSFTEGTYNVMLKKTLPAGKWTSLVLPFSATTQQLVEAFPNGAANTEIAVISSMRDNKVYFTTKASVTANEPFLIKVDDPAGDNTYTFKGVTIVNDATPYGPDMGGIHMRGIYKRTSYDEDPIYRDRQHLYFVAQSKFYDWSYLNSMSPFSAYIYSDANTSVSQGKALVFMLDDEPTGVISRYGNEADIENAPVFNAMGQRISRNAKGIQIINGKKFFKK